MPNNCVAYNYFNLGIAEAYYNAEVPEKANEIVTILNDATQDDLRYYFSLEDKFAGSTDYEIKKSMMVMQELSRLTRTYKQDELNKKIDEDFKNFYVQFSSKVKE